MIIRKEGERAVTPPSTHQPFPRSGLQLVQEMDEDVGTEHEREEEAVDGAPEMGGVADVVLIPLVQAPAWKVFVCG